MAKSFSIRFNPFYWINYVVIRFLAFFICPLKLIGRENLPKTGGCILASNHLSHLDPMLLGATIPRQISFVARDNLFSVPVVGWWIKTLNAFPIKRNSADIKALREVIARVRTGIPVLVFPEGTRQADQVQPGIGFLALVSRVPVIPIYLHGTNKVLSPGSRCLKYHPVTIVFGKPLQFDHKLVIGETHQSVADQIMRSINELKEQASLS